MARITLFAWVVTSWPQIASERTQLPVIGQCQLRAVHRKAQQYENYMRIITDLGDVSAHE